MKSEHLSEHSPEPELVAARSGMQIIELAQVQDHPPAQPGDKILRDVNPLLAIRARLQVRVGFVHMTVGELLSARENQVFLLDKSVEHPVDLMLEDKVVARGQLVAMDGSFALRVTELPVPLKV